MEQPVRLEELVDLVERGDPGGGPLDALAASVLVSAQLTGLADDLVGYFVNLAREAGASWAEIGQCLGVTKQAAQKRFVAAVTTKRRRGLFTRFAEPAREVVVRAQRVAREAGSAEIGTGHILLGLLEDTDSLGARAIAASGTPAEQIAELARAGLQPAGTPSPGHIPFSAEAKKTLELSLREALRLGHSHIGTEHILLGLLRDERSTAAKILAESGVARRTVEAWIVETLEER
jgi:hypothetical protein